MTGPDRAFWQEKFETGSTPWDRGGPGPQLVRWLADGTLSPETLAGPMAVPGCGRGYELVALAERGIDVTGIDYADAAVEAARARVAAAGLEAKAQVVQADVLEWRPSAPLAAVYEQTCLCALHPDHWRRYADALHAWIRPGGRLYVLAAQVDRPGAADGLIEGPPFDVSINALRALFDATRWDWPAPPYPRVPHPYNFHELGLVLVRR